MLHFNSDVLSNLITALGGHYIPGVFEKLQTAYAEETRFYHNATHIEDCLAKLELFKDTTENYSLIALALFYHDVVYDSRRKDNEALSADWSASDLTAAGIADDHVRCIHAMILATQSHQAKDADTRLLLDIDLSILGTSAEDFAAYDNAIRQEYSWVPIDDYSTGRKKVLEHFLKREHIYFTPVIAEAYEAQARVNLGAALEALS